MFHKDNIDKLAIITVLRIIAGIGCQQQHLDRLDVRVSVSPGAVAGTKELILTAINQALISVRLRGDNITVRQHNSPRLT